MESYREHIEKILKKETGHDVVLEVPPDPNLGDYAFPCFSLAKQLKKNPNEIAKELCEKIKPDTIIDQVKVAGAYLNFWVNKKSLTKNTIALALKQKEKFGSSKMGKGKKILLEHTSINPNASPHVGRARNALIGDSLARILRFCGYKLEVHYFVNDIGKQIAMLVWASKDQEMPDFDSLLGMYQKVSKEVEEDEEKEKQVLALLSELEKGNEKVRKDFKKIVDTAIKGQSAIMAEMGITYDSFDYESKYLFSKKTDEVLKLLKKTARFYFDKDNRVVLDQKGYGLGMDMPVLVLTRADGTSLYQLRDIAYAMEMTEKGECIVVLGEDHTLYSEQINVALLMLEKKPRKAVHYSFVLLEDGKMSTRKGNIVLLTEFMHEAMKKANDELVKRYEKADDSAAKIIGYGALKYSILKVSPEKNVVFSWDSAVSFDGETAPYIQYAYARIASIIRKHESGVPKKADTSLLIEKEEIELIKKIAAFPEIVEKTGRELRPNVIATYVYELAKQFNEFYHSHRILDAEPKVRDARLQLITAISQTIKNALLLLGIDVLEKM